MPIPERLQTFVLTGVFATIALIAIGTIIFQKRRSRMAKPEPQTATPAWIWVFLIVVVALITYLLSGRKPGQAPAPNPIPGWLAAVLVVGLLVVVFVVLIGYQLFRDYDRAAFQAVKRGKAGDTEGAIAELRAKIEAGARPDPATDSRNPYAPPRPRRNRSAARAEAMGLLHFMREEWPEAHRWLLEAEEIGGRNAHRLGNQAVALSKMGRSEEAIALLNEACSLAPLEVLHPCNLGVIFVDLGRIDEAREQLARAEANYKKLVMIPPSAKLPFGAQVDAFRAKLEAAAGSGVA